jgi:hypothetical protein
MVAAMTTGRRDHGLACPGTRFCSRKTAFRRRPGRQRRPPARPPVQLQLLLDVTLLVLAAGLLLLRLWPPSPSLSMDQAPPSPNQAPPLTDLGAPTEKSDLELIESIIWEDLARRMGVGVAGGGVGRVVWAVRRRRRWSTPSGRGFGRWVHASITTM